MEKKYKVLIDIGSISINPYTGVGQVAIQYLNELAKLNDLNIDIQLLLKNNVGDILPLCFPRQYTVKTPQSLYGKFIKKSYERTYAPSTDYQLRHSLAYVASLENNRKAPLLTTIHDANPLILKSSSHARFSYRMNKAIEQSERLVFISEYARHIVTKYFDLSHKQSSVIYNGVHFHERQCQPQDFINKGQPFLMFIGRVVPAKNVHLLVEMMRYLPDMQLVIAGNLYQDPVYSLKVKMLIWRYGLVSRITLMGKISEANKTWLLAHCVGVLLPSKAEGFGLPVIEAFHHGKPAFISNLTALPEIGGKQAYYWPHLEPFDMSEVIKNALVMEAAMPAHFIQARKQRSEKFTWHENVKSYLALYQAILK